MNRGAGHLESIDEVEESIEEVEHTAGAPHVGVGFRKIEQSDVGKKAA